MQQLRSMLELVHFSENAYDLVFAAFHAILLTQCKMSLLKMCFSGQSRRNAVFQAQLGV
jgi:hypothetical protein